MTLPTNVGKGTVIGRFGIQDGTVVGGSVTFTPSPSRWIDSSASAPMTLLPKPTTVNLDVTGYFTVDLVATDDTDLNPSGWTYTVSFNFVNGTAAPFSISVPEGVTTDLGVVSPVATSNGVAIIRGPGIPSGGATSQVLMKNSATDGDTAWANATDIPGLATVLATKAGLTLTKRTITANYTVTSADTIDTVLHSTAATGITITLPAANTSGFAGLPEVPIPWRQYGAGQITFAAASGATLISRGGATKSFAQYAEGTVTPTGTSTWLLSGDVA